MPSQKTIDEMAETPTTIKQAMAEEYQRARAMQAQALGAAIGTPVPGQSRSRQPRYSLSEKLSMRMGWYDIGDAADKHSTKLHIMHDSGKVFVFGVKNGEAFTLQDEADIFPSDQMVTQLRMVCGG